MRHAGCTASTSQALAKSRPVVSPKINSAGLQISRQETGRTDIAKTVEDYLEWALMKAGLMRKSNYGALHKVKWSRSSRTDKGVHSCATVVCLKVNCDKDHWDTDPEGIEYAQAINRYALHLSSVHPVALCLLHADI